MGIPIPEEQEVKVPPAPTEPIVEHCAVQGCMATVRGGILSVLDGKQSATKLCYNHLVSAAKAVKGAINVNI